MKIGLVIIGVLVLVGLLFGGKLMGTRNELVQQREAINGAWSQVDVDLQRRADLIPNLVTPSKGYAAARERRPRQHRERSRGIAGCAHAAGADQRQLATGWRSRPPAGGCRKLSAVESERALLPPAGRAGRNTENQIAVERRDTTRSFQRYNTNIQLFPNNIAASLFGFQRERRLFQNRTGRPPVPKVAF